MSMFVFCAAIDPVLEKLAELKCEVIAYADDVLIGLPSFLAVNDILNNAEILFAEIGLHLNKTKCKNTLDEDVNFVGFTFPHDKEKRVTIASRITGKVMTRL